MPGPEALKELARDEEIVNNLSVNDSLENRVRLLRTHAISYGYMQRIFQVCEDAELGMPPHASREDAITQAAHWMRKCPAQAADIATMFALTPFERSNINVPKHVKDKIAKTT